MDKKDRMYSMIQDFLQHAPDAPPELRGKLEDIASSIEQYPAEEIEKIDGVVSHPAGQGPDVSQNPVNLLFQAYGDMEKYAYTGEKDRELYSVIQQMRGFYGIPDRYFP